MFIIIEFGGVSTNPTRVTTALKNVSTIYMESNFFYIFGLSLIFFLEILNLLCIVLKINCFKFNLSLYKNFMKEILKHATKKFETIIRNPKQEMRHCSYVVTCYFDLLNI